MTTVDRDSEFRSRLITDYQADNLDRADYIITMFLRMPEQALASPEACRALVFALELWAAHHGQPHAAVLQAEQPQRRFWRTASKTEQALEALSLLSQSPLSTEFAADLDPLRSRLLAVAHHLAQSHQPAST